MPFIWRFINGVQVLRILEAICQVKVPLNLIDVVTALNSKKHYLRNIPVKYWLLALATIIFRIKPWNLLLKKFVLRIHMQVQMLLSLSMFQTCSTLMMTSILKQLRIALLNHLLLTALATQCFQVIILKLVVIYLLQTVVRYHTEGLHLVD